MIMSDIFKSYLSEDERDIAIEESVYEIQMAKLTKKMKNGDEISLPLIDQKKENVVSEDFVFIDCSNKDDLKSFYICKH